MTTVLDIIRQQKIISAIRVQSEEHIAEVVASLYSGGVKVIEITMNTPNALNHIEKIKQNYPDAIIGVGTVLDAETTRSAIMAGASFLLSPLLNKEAIQMASRYNVPFIPGVLTPTEIITAYEYGAKAVKIFPISSLGPKYLKDILAPLPHVEIVPMGGITADNAKQYLEAGSLALGMGSTLVNDQLIKEGNFLEIESRARQLVGIVDQFNRETSDTL